MFSVGIVGLPNVGKTTLFNALASASAEVSNFPFCTVEPNSRLVPIPDPRLNRVADIFSQQERVPTGIEFVDIAGLVKGASKGEGLGNQFLGHIREADAILHTIRCFPSETIAHVSGSLDPIRDIEIVNLELCLADLATLEKRLTAARRDAKAGDRKHLREVGLLETWQQELAAGRFPSWPSALTPEDEQFLKDCHLLTVKPTLFALNIADEPKDSQPLLSPVQAWLEERRWPFVLVPARLEAEFNDLAPQEAAEFRKEMGIERSALDAVILASYRLLDLITFFTAVGRQAKAWTLPKGSTALEAAAKIHSDMAARFIKAEVLPFDVLNEVGDWQAARDRGLVNIQGRDYQIQDGDVLQIRFGA